MTMPLDLVLVRHGQSEGNAAKRHSEDGDHTVYSSEFLERHNSSFRLTDRGIRQAEHCGVRLIEDFCKDGPGFDKYYVSGAKRAIETAALLNLPDASWYVDLDLTERDWGDMDNLPETVREEKFGEWLRQLKNEPFYGKPANGESMMGCRTRLKASIIDRLHRECSDKRVIIVCHGEIMWAFRTMLELMSQEQYRQLHISPDPTDKIHNCQYLHYTRRNPETGRLSETLDWMRTVRPASNPVWVRGWQRIERRRYTNEELMQMAQLQKRMLAA